VVLNCFKVTYRHSPVQAKYLITGVLTKIYFRKQARLVITAKGLDEINMIRWAERVKLMERRHLVFKARLEEAAWEI
jgi:hypothetical protein